LNGGEKPSKFSDEKFGATGKGGVATELATELKDGGDLTACPASAIMFSRGGAAW
jgi:hypothetical protein